MHRSPASPHGHARKRRLLRGLTIGAGVAILGLTLLTPSPALAATACAAPAGSGLVVNEWVGPQQSGNVGQWETAANWSLGTAPNLSSTNQLVCIRGAATVRMPALAGIQVNAAKLDLGGTTVLDIQEGNKLFVDGDPTVVASVVRVGTRVDVSGATIGGSGVMDLGGRIVWKSLGTHAAATITTRNCSLFNPTGPSGCTGRPTRPGLLRIQPGGRLEVASASAALGVNLFDEYRIRVQGQLRLSGAGGYVAADHGTRLTVLAASGTVAAGRLDLLNDGGWLEGRDPFHLPRSVIENHGLMSKNGTSGSTVIDAGFPSNDPGPTRILSGTLALAGVSQRAVLVGSGRTYASGRCTVSGYNCAAVPTTNDLQTTAVQVPTVDTGGANVLMVEQARTVPGMGNEVRVDVTGLAVTRANPAVLSLRYDAALRGSRTPATTQILRQHGTSTAFALVPPCTSTGTVPSTATACVDRRASASRIVAGDLLMIVKTISFSRWVGR